MFRRRELQFTAWVAAAIFGLLILAEAVALWLMVESIDSQIDEDIRATATETAERLDVQPGVASVHAPAPDLLEGLASHRGAFVIVIDERGSMVANPSAVENPLDYAPTLLASARRQVAAWQTLEVGARRVRVYELPLVEDNAFIGAVLVGHDLTARDGRVRTAGLALLGIAAAGLPLSVGIGHLIARRAMAPLREAYERQQRFAGQASHELRSPLAAARTAIDVVAQGRLSAGQRTLIDEARSVIMEASEVIHDLLEETRLTREPGAGPDEDVSELDRVVAAECARLAPWLEACGLRVNLALDANLTAAIQPRRLRRLTRALLENVEVHTPRGTTLLVTAYRDGEYAVLAVDDDGPGIPAPERARLFEQGEPRTGPAPGDRRGIGLSIVRDVARGCGGDLAGLESSRGGLRVEVRLPLASEHVPAAADQA